MSIISQATSSWLKQSNVVIKDVLVSKQEENVALGVPTILARVLRFLNESTRIARISRIYFCIT